MGEFILNLYYGLSIMNIIFFSVYLLDYKAKYGYIIKSDNIMARIVDLLKIFLIMFTPLLDIVGFLVLVNLIFCNDKNN